MPDENSLKGMAKNPSANFSAGKRLHVRGGETLLMTKAASPIDPVMRGNKEADELAGRGRGEPQPAIPTIFTQ